jgi:hypothetical protein|tara:strand:- start:452 stop:712 length:261 start_codon:yes stop_codon:yes gene_type:complete
MVKKSKNTKLKLMSIITEKITDFVNYEECVVNEIETRDVTKYKITEEQLDEYVEEIPIDEEVGFVTIREMRRTIKDLIKTDINEEY